MRKIVLLAAIAAVAIGYYWLSPPSPASAPRAESPFTDFRDEKPGSVHRITPGDLPAPRATRSYFNGPSLVSRPANAWPEAPAGFHVALYASGLDNPRELRVAPNGDLFVAESAPGRIRVLRGVRADGSAAQTATFAAGLRRPFGIAFDPPGAHPSYVYVANNDSVVRFRYSSGDLEARSPAEVVIPRLPAGGHWTRDLAFSLDGKTMYVSVGSASNDDDTDNNPGERRRADILACSPDGSGLRVFAWGLRNAVGIAIDPATGILWASVNERDGLGDNLPPDFITHVEDGGFYGWPWFYIGGHQDPRHAGKHPELREKVVVPDVLVQPHNASLQLAFYEAGAFPARFRGGIFAAEHGSWNRSVRTGYEVIFVPVANGRASGGYEDFLTGFVTRRGGTWGRPVGVAAGADGSLFVSDDGTNSIWRVSYPAR